MSLIVPGLHDIHLPPSPGWWPPAPGWWLLAGMAIVALAWSTHRVVRARRKARRIAAAMHEFDVTVAGAAQAPARLAAASALLRRAALTRHPAAASLDGKAWLHFLDGDDPARAFSEGQGALLVDGAFRRTFDADIEPALALARSRFAALLTHERVEHGDA
jgi:uncharacterized protein DUF4381